MAHGYWVIILLAGCVLAVLPMPLWLLWARPSGWRWCSSTGLSRCRTAGNTDRPVLGILLDALEGQCWARMLSLVVVTLLSLDPVPAPAGVQCIAAGRHGGSVLIGINQLVCQWVQNSRGGQPDHAVPAAGCIQCPAVAGRAADPEAPAAPLYGELNVRPATGPRPRPRPVDGNCSTSWAPAPVIPRLSMKPGPASRPRSTWRASPGRRPCALPRVIPVTATRYFAADTAAVVDGEVLVNRETISMASTYWLCVRAAVIWC